MTMPRACAIGLGFIAITASGATLPPLADAAFLTDCHHAMDRMMAGMASAPSGDADRDFATMMIPHHQGAIDMAVAELEFGRDPTLRRIAQEIVVDQQQEIIVMRRAIAEAASPARPTDPTLISNGMVMK